VLGKNNIYFAYNIGYPEYEKLFKRDAKEHFRRTVLEKIDEVREMYKQLGGKG
jgi:hypothetical protein